MEGDRMMTTTLLESTSGLLAFFSYFGAALGFLLVFCAIYCKVTPYDELKLVREGKVAPAISFGGAFIGFVLPLYSAITHSVGFFDMLVWALIAMLVQILVFSIVRMFFKDLVRQIEENQVAAATLLAFYSVAIGILNAASMTY
jgi:putative membrane protein